MNVSNLAPGAYTVCITIAGKIYEQCFTLNIARGTSLTGKLSVKSKVAEVEIEEGTAPFQVFVNGYSKFETTAMNFTVPVELGDFVEVKSAKVCEGSYTKSISDDLSGVLGYPNPTRGFIEIATPTIKTAVLVEVYNLNGQLISNGMYPILNGKVSLNLENEISGVYVAKVYLETPVSVTIIKK